MTAIISFVMGFAVISPMVDRMSALAGGAGGYPPDQERIRQLGAIQRRLRGLGMLSMCLLIVAVIAMASARFL